MKGYIIILGVVFVAVYASAADSEESVNGPEPGTASEPAEQPYHREDRHSDGTFTRTGIFSDDLLYHDHFQSNGAITRTYSYQPASSSTSQIAAPSSIINAGEEWFRAGMLRRGFTQEPNGVWWKHHPGKVNSYENQGGTRTPKGIGYRILSGNAAGKLTTIFIADDMDETTYSGILVPGTTSLDEDTLFTLMGYTRTPRGIWYKIVPRELFGERVNKCTVFGPDGEEYTGLLQLGTSSPDETTLFEKIMGYTATPSGIWYKIVFRKVLDEWVKVCLVVGPDGGFYSSRMPFGSASPDDAALLKIMGKTGTPGGI